MMTIVRKPDTIDEMKRLLTSAVLVLGVVAAGCIEPPAGVAMTNDLDTPVVIVYAADSGEVREHFEPGEARVLRLGLSDLADKSRCTTADLVILSNDDQELGRVPPPVCIDDGVWTSYWTGD
jgi:hypothetical protein